MAQTEFQKALRNTLKARLAQHVTPAGHRFWHIIHNSIDMVVPILFDAEIESRYKITEYRTNGRNVTYSQAEQIYATFALASIGSQRANTKAQWEAMMEDASVLYGQAPIQGRDWITFFNDAAQQSGEKLAARLDHAINHFFGLPAPDMRTGILYLTMINQICDIWLGNLKLIQMGSGSDLTEL